MTSGSLVGRVIEIVRRRFIDGATIILVVLAGFLALRPGSALSVWWSQRQESKRLDSLASQQWSAVRDASAPLAVTHNGVRIVEVMDYECPFCRIAVHAVDSAVVGGLGVAILHLPLPVHPRAAGAARAALCAESAGRFREFHLRVLTTVKWVTDTNWVREAVSAGIADTTGFRRCLNDTATHRRLMAHEAAANDFRAQGTPTFISARRLKSGAQSFRQLRAILEP